MPLSATEAREAAYVPPARNLAFKSQTVVCATRPLPVARRFVRTVTIEKP